MKITKVLFTAAILVFAIALFSCDDGGGLGLLGAKDVKDLQGFDVDAVADKYEAEQLLKTSGIFNSLLSILKSADSEAYTAAFLKDYNMNQSSYISSKYYEKSISTSVNIDDKEKLKAKANVAIAAINGSSSYSWSSNKSYYELNSYIGSGYASGDWRTTKRSFKKTFSITDGFYSNSSYKIAGYVTVEGSDSSTYTMVDKDKGDTANSNSGTYKLSAAVTIIGPITTKAGVTKTAGGKYRFSFSDKSSGAQRTTSGKGETIESDIEVYNNKNELLFTIGEYYGDSDDGSEAVSNFFNSYTY